jgi:hypothetical protein
MHTVTCDVDTCYTPAYLGTCVHPKHPKKEVNEALDYADERDIEVEKTPSGHKVGSPQVHVRPHVLGLVDTEEPVQPRATDPQMG